MMQDMEIRRIVDRHLFNEKLLWLGKPSPSRFAFNQVSRGTGLLLGAIALLVLTPFFSQTITRNERTVALNPSFLLVVGGAFVLAAIWSGVKQRRKAQSLIYAITDKRAMIIEPLNKDDVTVKSIGVATNITRRNAKDGKGDLIFGREPDRSSRGSEQTREIGFFGIENVDTVERMLQQTLNCTTESLPW